MTKKPSERAVMTSILDRLIDEDPSKKGEAPRPAHPVLRDLEASIRRDLRNLVRTRHRAVGWDDETLDQLRSSVLAYGVPDMTATNLSTEESLTAFVHTIEGVIHRNEPRFRKVTVLPGTEEEPPERTLRIRIEATLYADPAPEFVTFESTIEPDTKSLDIDS